MELVDRIHLDPLGRDLKILEQLSCESRRISQQRIKMRGGIEDKAAPPKCGAESAEHVVPLEQKNFQSRFSEDVPAEQPAYTRPDYDRVVVRRVLTAEDRRHGEKSSQKSKVKRQKSKVRRVHNLCTETLLTFDF